MVCSNRQFVRFAICVLFFSPLLSHGQSSRKGDVLNFLSNQSGFLRYSRFSGEPSPSKEARSILERQARWDNPVTSDSNQLGLRLHFEKIDEQTAPGSRLTVRYRVLAEGAPQDKVFALQTWKIDNTFTTDPRDLYVNTQGLLMVHKPKPEQDADLQAPGDELVVVSATESAEPLRFLLSRRDGETPIYGTLVSHPVVSYDQGCKLEVRMAQPGAMAVLIAADGFPAKSRIPLVLGSEGSIASETMTADSGGHAVLAFWPSVPGKSHGVLKVSAEGPDCLPSVTLPWDASTHFVTKPQ